MNGILTSVDLAVAARSMDIRYKLGAGGMDPTDRRPTDAKGRLDCTGLTCWADGLSRRQLVNGKKVWLSTAGIRTDALGPQRWYRLVTGAPQLGDLLIYARHMPSLRLHGHASIVTGVDRLLEWDPAYLGCWSLLDATHCASGHKAPRAVRETPATLWGKYWGKPNGTVIVRRAWR